MPLREPVSAHLAEALSWMVAHSQTSSDALAPGSMELAEALWLARQLPEPPRRPKENSRATVAIPPEREPSALRPEPPKVEDAQKPTPLPPDPFLPSPFPEDEEQSAPEDTLLPVAVLPDERDVDRDLDGLLPGRVREEKPLGDRETLLRALAPLLRRRPDHSRQRFAEEPTVDLYAQTGVLQPVFEPSQGPAFDEVLLIRDGGVSMQAWRRQAEELQTVLASTQVFPRVRLQELQPGPVERSKDPAIRERAVKQLSGVAQLLPGSRPLLLCLSDTAGRHWWDGRMFAALEIWGRTCPTAILHPLPIWHWNRTALAAVERVSVRNASPAAANPAYGMDPLNWWDQPLPLGRDLPLPVLPLEQQSLGTWSGVVMGHPADATPGVALLPGPQREQRLRQLLGDRDLSAPSPAPEPLTAKEAAARWEAFQAMASPEAQQLMKVMATSPLLTLPVIRLLHAAQGGKVTSPLPIAEVLTSGLVVRKLEPPTNPEGDEEASTKPLEPEQFQFEVLSEVAALLQQQLSATERRDVISRVSALVERRWNRIRRSDEPSFEAVLCDPTAQPPERLKNGLVQFASVTARLLDTLPGEEAKAFAERIRQGSGLPPGSPWPSSMVFDDQEFETTQLVNVPQLETFPVTSARFVEAELRRIGFQTATLQPDSTPRFFDGEAWAFHDPLQRDHLPFGATADKADPLALTLVEIPAGSFQMGSPPDEPQRSAAEGPQHEVTLQSFFISQTPITQAQWRQVAHWSEQPGEHWGRDLEPNPSRFSDRPDSDQRPVEQVSWHEAMEFCSRLSQRTGRTYTLPSEAQWEYACRAGSTTPFHFGATITAELANYDGTYTYADGPKGVYRQQTTPVRKFPANDWGLHDMHGNVDEWCLDHWHTSYEGAPTDGSAWLTLSAQNKKPSTHSAGDQIPGKDWTSTSVFMPGTATATQKVENKSSSDEKPRLLRGGSWVSNPRNCRSAFRFHVEPVDAYGFIGFRVVCLPQDPSLNS